MESTKQTASACAAREQGSCASPTLPRTCPANIATIIFAFVFVDFFAVSSFVQAGSVSDEQFAVQVVARDNFIYVLRSRSVSRIPIDRWSGKNATNLEQEQLLWDGEPLVHSTGIAIGDDGTIFIADPGASRVFYKSPSEKMRALPSSAKFVQPTGVSVDGRAVYVADVGSSSVYRTTIDDVGAIQIYADTSGSAPQKILVVGQKLIGLSPNSTSLVLMELDPRSRESGLEEDPSGSLARRGEILDFKSNVIDFAALGQFLYLLNAPAKGAASYVTVFSLIGGGSTTFLPPAARALGSTAISADLDRLYFSSARQTTFTPRVVPASLIVDARLSSEPLTNLYSYLLEGDSLQTKQYELTAGTSIGSLVKKKLILPAGYSQSFDLVFCRLNARHCDKGRPRQRLLPGDLVVMPDVAMNVVASRRAVTLPYTPDQFADPRFSKHAGGELGDLAAEFVLHGTSKTKLRSDLEKLNYSYKGKNILEAKSGAFLIPVQLLSATFAVNKADVENRDSRFYALKASGGSISSPAQVEGITVQTHVAASREHKPALVVHAGDARCSALSDRMWTKPFELIHYCRPLLSPSQSPRSQGSIGIVDYHFDPSHPEFLDMDTHVSALHMNSPIEHRAIAAQPGAASNSEWDHGTHLAALIGARGVGQQMIGVDPESALYAVKTGDFVTAVDREYGLRIYNISLAEDASAGPGSMAPYRKTIESDERRDILFVVAAGNSGSPVDADSLAGLGTQENVLVVGATDQSEPPRLWMNSNYDSQFVGIVAPGKDVKSAVFGGGYEIETGTSQATALVSGAATLLSTVEPNWEAWKIKQRLVSSADLWFGADKKFVLGGILNIQAAVLDTSAAVFRLHNQGTCVATINSIGPANSNFIDISQPGEPNLKIHHSWVRRIHRHEDGFTFTVIYSETTKDGKHYHSLSRREANGSAFTGDTSLQLNPQRSLGCGNRRSISISEIDDLLNGFYK